MYHTKLNPYKRRNLHFITNFVILKSKEIYKIKFILTFKTLTTWQGSFFSRSRCSVFRRRARVRKVDGFLLVYSLSTFSWNTNEPGRCTRCRFRCIAVRNTLSQNVILDLWRDREKYCTFHTPYSKFFDYCFTFE